MKYHKHGNSFSNLHRTYHKKWLFKASITSPFKFWRIAPMPTSLFKTTTSKITSYKPRGGDDQQEVSSMILRKLATFARTNTNYQPIDCSLTRWRFYHNFITFVVFSFFSVNNLLVVKNEYCDKTTWSS